MTPFCRKYILGTLGLSIYPREFSNAETLYPGTLYLGVDVQAAVSSYCLLTADPADKPQQGKVTLEGFPKLLENAKPRFLACEFTGSLAVPFAQMAKEAEVKTFYLDTVSRSAYTRLFGQTSKTDKQDAKTIARVRNTRAEKEEAYQMRPHLFLDAEDGETSPQDEERHSKRRSGKPGHFCRVFAPSAVSFLNRLEERTDRPRRAEQPPAGVRSSSRYGRPEDACGGNQARPSDNQTKDLAHA